MGRPYRSYPSALRCSLRVRGCFARFTRAVLLAQLIIGPSDGELSRKASKRIAGGTLQQSKGGKPALGLTGLGSARDSKHIGGLSILIHVL